MLTILSHYFFKFVYVLGFVSEERNLKVVWAEFSILSSVVLLEYIVSAWDAHQALLQMKTRPRAQIDFQPNVLCRVICGITLQLEQSALKMQTIV
jgi:hypothetical protein